MSKVRVMHYINQFFAGIGGEDKADIQVGSFAGPVGPGKRLQQLLGNSAEIVVTAYCGDNYFTPHSRDALASIVKIARDNKVDIVVAGPAFNSGRHGIACAEVCHAMSTSLGLTCITGMDTDNVGITTYKQYKDRKVFAVPTAATVAGMDEALTKIAQFVSKVAAGAAVKAPVDEGYIPHGLRVNEFVSSTGAERAVDMLLKKVTGKPFTTEIPVEYVDLVPGAPKVDDLNKAKLALVTTMGIIPPGNPDGFKMYRSDAWNQYEIGNLSSMQEARWDVVHGGYNSAWMLKNPNYCVPLDVCRELEKEGVLGSLSPYLYSTSGSNGIVPRMQVIGREIAGKMKAEGVDASILVSA